MDLNIIKILFYICALSGIFTVFSLLLYKIKFQKVKSTLVIYIIGRIFLSCGFIMYANRDILFSHFAVWLANSLMFAGICLEMFALIYALRKYNNRQILYALMTAAFFSLCFYWQMPLSPSTWVLTSSIFTGIMFGYTAVYLLVVKDMNSMQRITGGLLSILSLSMFIRAFNVLISGQQVVLYSAGVIQIGVYIAFFLLSYLVPIFYLFILKENDQNIILDSKEKFKAVIENAMSGIIILEMIYDEKGKPIDYKYVSVNPSFEKYVGIKAKNLVGKRSGEVISPIDRPHALSAYKKIIKTGKHISFEYFFPELNKYFTINSYKISKSQLAVIFIDITLRKKAEKELQKALLDKQALLKELQHRVKNSFSMISGMVQLSASNNPSPEVKAVLQVIEARVKAMSQLYSHLYRTDNYENVQLDHYSRQVTTNLLNMADNLRLTASFEPISVSFAEAVPVGLIITELVTNSIKYAFPDNQEGQIIISLKRTEKGGELSVRDDGIGLPVGFDILKDSDLGLTLVQALASQLEGTIRNVPGQGTHWIVEFCFLDRNTVQ